jgi:hypothetical protein
MASKLEQAMNERREEAEAAAREAFPGLRDCIVNFGHGQVIVEVKDKHGHWRRFAHTPVGDDEILATQAEQQTQRREVVHGPR